MRVLWITNMLMPDAAQHMGVQTSSSGTWMIDISRMLAEQDDIQLAIACVYGKENKVFQLNGITYYLLPGTGRNMLFYTKKYEKIWKNINAEFRPDIVHLHGTEYSHGLAFLRACPNVKAVVSIQGILNRIKDVDFGGLTFKDLFFNRTLKQFLKMNGEIEMHSLHKKNAKHETEILQRVSYINGVNTWDISLCKSINPKLKAFKLEYNLRCELYGSPKWSIDKMDRHTIFTNPGGTPLKGVHQLFKAVALLKNKYPDIKVKVPGMGKDGKLQITSAYTKYLSKLLKKLKLENNVVFMDRQSAQQMCDNMLSANVTVIPSAIEGTSLILRESMFLGCPCIASFRGGMADYISDKQDGFLYDYQEYPYLAARLDELFSNDELAKSFSDRAIEKASNSHNREKNIKEYIEMYRFINSGDL